MLTRSILLSSALLLVSLNHAPAAVIYTQISIRKNPDGSVPFDKVRVGDWMLAATAGAYKSYEFDVDGDGAADFGLYSTVDRTDSGQSFGGVYASSMQGTEILGCPYPPPYSDPDSLAVGMPAGSLIDADSPQLYTPQTGVAWAGPNVGTGRNNMLSQPLTDGQGGTFYVSSEDVTGFLASRILKEDGWHYGWLEAAGGNFGLEIYGIAWEADPNKTIIAGLIPEPSSAFLSILGVTFFMTRRSREHRP